MGNLGSSFHRKSDIGFLHGWGVVGSISGDCNDVSKLLEAGDHQVLVIWSRSGKNLKLVSNDFHVFSVTDDFIGSILALDDDFFTSLLVNKSTNEIIELGTIHAHSLISILSGLDDTALFGDSNGGDFVVSGHHSDSYSSLVAVNHSLGHLFSDDILNTNDRDKSEIALFNDMNLRAFLLFLVVLSSLVMRDVPVGQCDGSEGLLCKGSDLSSKVASHSVIKLNTGSILGQVVGAGFQDDLGGTLDANSALAINFNYSGHSLSGRVELGSEVVSVLLSVSGNITSSSFAKFEHGQVSSLNTIFTWKTLGVTGNSLFKQLKGAITLAERLKLIRGKVRSLIWVGNWSFSTLPDVSQSHLVLGQSTSLV